MSVKVMRRPVLTFWEKLYIPQILCGLKITTRHFFRNLLLHIAHLLGRLKHLPASATIQYPEELRPLMERFRSRHRLTRREDDTPRCVGCMLCETVCPAKCITIVPGEHPDPHVEKYPGPFRHRLGFLRLLRLLRGGVPRGRHPHGHGNPGRGGLLQRRDAAGHP